jgi:hypothetical protein
MSTDSLAKKVQDGFWCPEDSFRPVPFYFWSGESLDKNRVSWQLDRLREGGIRATIVSYAHHPDGPTDDGNLPLFTPEWWNTIRWFLHECEVRGMTCGFQDYTILESTLRRIGSFQKQPAGELFHETQTFLGGRELEWNIMGEGEVVAVVAWNVDDLHPPLLISWNKEKAQIKRLLPPGTWKISIVRLRRGFFNPLEKQAGQAVCDEFYDPFLKECPGAVGKILTIFFQDELDLGLRMPAWSEDVEAEFIRRKGYDVMPWLPALWHDLGPRTEKVRLDFYDVITSLLEERFFIPLFKWHNRNGTLWGHDNFGRGEVREGHHYYGDYFRTMRWFSAPGNDAPDLKIHRPFIGAKVNSSISHLYDRQRVWVEGFYGSGWGIDPADLLKAIHFAFAAGANFYNPHGLWYSSKGGWWEWASPDTHFRQPFWKHMEKFHLGLARTCYLLTRGSHVCDVAILYPIADLESKPVGAEKTDTALEVSEDLFCHGIDSDLVDFQSLERAVAEKGKLRMGDEVYQALIFGNLTAVRYSTLEKALEFKRAGGIVLAEGVVPIASDREGRNDRQLEDMVAHLFPEGALAGVDEIRRVIGQKINRDFEVEQEGIVVNHRATQTLDIYFVHNASGQMYDGAARFRTLGTPSCWNVWTGEMFLVDDAELVDGMTRLSLMLGPGEAQFIVFDRNQELSQKRIPKAKIETNVVTLSDEWEFTLQPTLNNRWGDFSLPASPDTLGAEVRCFQFREEFDAPATWWKEPGVDAEWVVTTFSYGTPWWFAGPFSSGPEMESLAQSLSQRMNNPREPLIWQGERYPWKPLSFSKEWGIEDDPYLRDWQSGPHGLKGMVPEEGIDLHSETPGVCWVIATTLRMKESGSVVLSSGSRAAYKMWLSGNKILDKSLVEAPGEHPRWHLPHYRSVRKEIDLELNQGLHSLVTLVAQPTGQRTRLHLSACLQEAKLTLEKMGSPGGDKTDLFESYPVDYPKATWFRFSAPPGARHLKIVSRGDLAAWCGGKAAVVGQRPGRDGEVRVFDVTLSEASKLGEEIFLRIGHVPGVYRGALIHEPVKLVCETGKISLGDWHDRGLPCYSGGARYRQKVNLTNNQADAVEYLDLGQLSATAEIWINGQCMGTLISPPWKIKTSGFWKTGENNLEILILSSLAGFYREWIPTPYRDTIKQSGLMGPVRLLLRDSRETGNVCVKG